MSKRSVHTSHASVLLPLMRSIAASYVRRLARMKWRSPVTVAIQLVPSSWGWQSRVRPSLFDAAYAPVSRWRRMSFVIFVLHMLARYSGHLRPQSMQMPEWWIPSHVSRHGLPQTGRPVQWWFALSELQLRADGTSKPIRPEFNVRSGREKRNFAHSLIRFWPMGAVSINVIQLGT